MKELSIEQKAKRYDKAIEIAREINNEQRAQPFNVMTRVFPELKESEDEKIRKDIIRVFRGELNYTSKEDANKYIAWLEKQGKLKEHNICDTCDEQYSCISPCPVKLLDKQGEQKPAVEIKTPEESLGIDSETYNKIVDECIYGKQEPADKVEPKFKVGDLVKYTNHIKQPIYKINYIEKECYVCTSDDVTLGDKAVMHFAFDNPYLRLVEQKPVDVVEPKFHEGDWVVNKFGDVWHIDSFDEKNYQVSDGKGSYNYFPILKQDEMRLWTIQDAKPGDVLACNSDILSICIFAHFDGINNKYDSFLCYCGLEGEGLGQELNINGYHDDSTGYVPATKEQRDLLFRKMEEAGYEWDADKKEPRKINSYCEKYCKGYQETGRCFVDGDCQAKREAEQNHDWSEENERICQCLIQDQEEALDKISNDKYGHSEIIPDLEEMYRERIAFLKSLKERYIWKPSDEQMDALDDALSLAKNCGEESAFDLRTLYEQLKKI